MNRTFLKNAVLFLGILFAASFGAHAETVLKSGSWTKKSYSVAGSWKIVKDGTTTKLVLTGMKTKSGPDLKLFLSPTVVGSLNGKTATKGAHKIAALKSSKGGSEYVIPSSVDLSKYKSLALHCEKFSKLWGAAAL